MINLTRTFPALPLLLGLLACALLSCEKTPPAPVLTNVEPTFGSAETLVTFEGMNLANISELTFSDQVVNFNTAYNSDNALLFRIPTNIPLGEHEVRITTPGGSVTTNFRITLEPPEIFYLNPGSGLPGDIVSVIGKNFFPPLEFYFFDSIQAEILYESVDSIVVQVPEGIEKGQTTIVANGGTVRSPIDFFSERTILVNDFDGNGVRSETERWIFVGEINETASSAVHNTDPEPIDNNFLKLSGTDNLDISWIGGVQNNFGFPGDTFETFGISVPANRALLEMDIHNNGRTNTYAIFILLENGGSPNDFTYRVPINGNGWEHLSFPLSRFKDLDGNIVDPTKVRILKIHLIDQDDSNTTLEVNVDNIIFKEIS